MPDLWKRFSKADVLIYLDAQLPTVARRQRRGDWTQERLDVQRERLAHARDHCDLYLATDSLTSGEVAECDKLWAIAPLEEIPAGRFRSVACGEAK